MIYISAYNSRTLDKNSYHRFGEGGITYITTTEADEDISDELNFHNHLTDDGQSYPNWDELAFCLRTDWKRLICLPVKEGENLKSYLDDNFAKFFDSPQITLLVCNTLTDYASYMKQDFDGYQCSDRRLKTLYCLNKDVYYTLKCAFEAVEQGNDEDGLSRFREALIVASVKNSMELAVWDFYH